MNVFIALKDDFFQRNPLDAANNLSNLAHVARLCPVFDTETLHAKVSTVLLIFLCRKTLGLYEAKTSV